MEQNLLNMQMLSYQVFFAWLRALDHPDLGLKFGPIPDSKKYVFFPISDKIPILTKPTLSQKTADVSVEN